jgi:type II secretory pathway pseudopilin PulG
MKHAAGITLIETMVAMALGSFILLGLITAFSQSQSVYRETERIARLHENLRFAQATLIADVRLANFWGRTYQAENISRSSGVSVSCHRRDVTAWALDVLNGIEANDEIYALPCPGTRPSEKSDVLIVRHARPATTVPVTGSVQIQSSGSSGIIFSHPMDSVEFRPGAEVFDLTVNAYYVSERSNYDAELPALRRLSLVRGVMQDQEIISGISSLQVQLGLDTVGDDRVDRYVEGGDISLAQPENRVIAVRLKLVIRSKRPRDRSAEIMQTIFLRNAQRNRRSPDSV